MMILAGCRCPRGAASIASKLLNTLVLALRCSTESGLCPSDLVGAAYMTDLTSIPGLMTISPEGGP